MSKRRQRSKEILYGIHPVTEAIRAGRRIVLEVYVQENRESQRIASVMQLCLDYGIEVRHMNSDQMARLVRSPHHQGVAARVSPLPSISLKQVIDHLNPVHPPILLLLDGITDVHNLGALLRTALCAGVDAVVIPKDRAAWPSPTVSAISAGAMEHMPVVVETNLSRSMEMLKANGIWIAGLVPNARETIHETDLTGPMALVLGSEQKGIRHLIKSKCDFLLSIPMKGPVASLNVSVAGAVVLYEAFRQRGVGKDKSG